MKTAPFLIKDSIRRQTDRIFFFEVPVFIDLPTQAPHKCREDYFSIHIK